MKSKTAWLELLSEEDLAFVKRFILASGSLKDLAESYGISYPTVRLRLDRLIQKIEIADSHEQLSHFEKVLQTQYADGKLELGTLKVLLAAHKKDKGP